MIFTIDSGEPHVGNRVTRYFDDVSITMTSAPGIWTRRVWGGHGVVIYGMVSMPNVMGCF